MANTKAVGFTWLLFMIASAMLMSCGSSEAAPNTEPWYLFNDALPGFESCRQRRPDPRRRGRTIQTSRTDCCQRVGGRWYETGEPGPIAGRNGVSGVSQCGRLYPHDHVFRNAEIPGYFACMQRPQVGTPTNMASICCNQVGGTPGPRNACTKPIEGLSGSGSFTRYSSEIWGPVTQWQ